MVLLESVAENDIYHICFNSHKGILFAMNIATLIVKLICQINWLLDFHKYNSLIYMMVKVEYVFCRKL